jgi:hypothetical protein
MTTTVDIHAIEADGTVTPVIYAGTFSIAAAIRVIDQNAAAPVNPHVRRRIHRERGGVLKIGAMTAEIAVHV